MSNLEVFKNQEFGEARTITIDNEPYFVGKDVAEILGYSRPDHAINNHIDNEDKLMYQIDTSGQKRQMFIIKEIGRTFLQNITDFFKEMPRKIGKWLSDTI